MNFVKRQFQFVRSLRSRFSRDHAPTTLPACIGMIASLGLAGCGVITSEDPTESLPLPAGRVASTGCVVSSASTRPYVYRCTVTSPGSDTPSELFATVVRDCTIPEKFTTQATTRQLFVGLTEITVIKQSGIEIDHQRALLSLVKAQLDATPVALVTITRREQRSPGLACISDFVVWRYLDDDVNLEALEKSALALANSSHFVAESSFEESPKSAG